MRQRQPGATVGGFGLLLIGGWLLAIALDRPLMDLSQIWPVIPMLFGLALLAQYASEKRKQSGLVFMGTVILLTSIFLAFFTLRIGRLTWPDMAVFWPIFPLITGAAFMTLYLADGMRQQTLLIPVFVTGGTGIIALPITLGVVSGSAFNQVIQLWPLLLLLIGLALLIKPRSQRSEDTNTEQR